MKRLIVSESKEPRSSLQNPENFNVACSHVKTMSDLGYNWESIQNRLLDIFSTYHRYHPDLDILRRYMGIQRGQDLK
jgi:hypothetical protein